MASETPGGTTGEVQPGPTKVQEVADEHGLLDLDSNVMSDNHNPHIQKVNESIPKKEFKNEEKADDPNEILIICSNSESSARMSDLSDEIYKS